MVLEKEIIMVKSTAPCFSLTASGTLKKTLTFQRKKGQNIVVKRHFPGSREPFTPSPKQLIQRAKIAELVARWKSLNDEEKQEWRDLAAKNGYQAGGYCYFIHSQGIKYVPTFEVDYFDFDDLADYFNILNSSIFATSELTLEVWFRSHLAAASQWIFSFYNNGMRFGIDGGDKAINVEIQGQEVGTDKYWLWRSGLESVLEDWVHLALTKPAHNITDDLDGFDAKLFVNGVEDTTFKWKAAKASADPDEICCGRLSPALNFARQDTCEYRIWDKILNPADILAHYEDIRSLGVANTPGASLANLMVHWKITGADTLAVKDWSGNNKDATKKGLNDPKLAVASWPGDFK